MGLEVSDNIGDILGTLSSLSWGMSEESPNARSSGAVLYGLKVALSSGH